MALGKCFEINNNGHYPSREQWTDGKEVVLQERSQTGVCIFSPTFLVLVTVCLLLHISRYRQSPLPCPNVPCNSSCFTILELQNHRESTHTKCCNLRMGALFALFIYFSVFLSSWITIFHLPMQTLKVSQASDRPLLQINPSTNHYGHLIYCHLQDVTIRCNPGGKKKKRKTPNTY